METHDLAERVERLESLLALQERTMEALSDVVAAQQRQLDELEKKLAAAGHKLRELHAGLDGSDSGPDDAPPPHYQDR